MRIRLPGVYDFDDAFYYTMCGIKWLVIGVIMLVCGYGVYTIGAAIWPIPLIMAGFMAAFVGLVWIVALVLRNYRAYVNDRSINAKAD